MRQKKSWEITDELWEEAKTLIPKKERKSNKEYKRKHGGGRRPMEARTVLEAIFYLLRTAIQCNALPKEFGSSSALHRYFLFWCEKGFFQALWLAGLENYDERKGIEWSWLSGDGCITHAPLAFESVAKNPSDRGNEWEQAPYACRGKGSGTCTSGTRR